MKRIINSISFSSKNLYSVVEAIYNGDAITLLVICNARGFFEVSEGSSQRSILVQALAIRIKDLDAVIVGVGHQEIILRSHCQSINGPIGRTASHFTN